MFLYILQVIVLGHLTRYYDYVGSIFIFHLNLPPNLLINLLTYQFFIRIFPSNQLFPLYIFFILINFLLIIDCVHFIFNEGVHSQKLVDLCHFLVIFHLLIIFQLFSTFVILVFLLVPTQKPNFRPAICIYNNNYHPIFN